VDFHKGCYVGQETVSRMESVGRANRVLTGLSGHFPCQPGLTLRTSAGHPAGTLTSVAPHFGMALTVALGYVNSRISESHFVVTDADGNPLGDCQRYEFPLL
jgi:folate-binding Fe-S cluster repair protein YgfZ